MVRKLPRDDAFMAMHESQIRERIARVEAGLSPTTGDRVPSGPPTPINSIMRPLNRCRCCNCEIHPSALWCGECLDGERVTNKEVWRCSY
jgi:hypothetical protein